MNPKEYIQGGRFEREYLHSLASDAPALHRVYLHLRDCVVRLGVANSVHARPLRVEGVEWDPELERDSKQSFLDYVLLQWHGIVPVKILQAYFTHGFYSSQPMTTANFLLVKGMHLARLEETIDPIIHEMHDELPHIHFGYEIKNGWNAPERRSHLSEDLDYLIEHVLQ